MKHEEEAVIVVGCQYQKGGRDNGVKGKARIYQWHLNEKSGAFGLS